MAVSEIKMEETQISIVTPVYQAENMLRELYSRITENIIKLNVSYEIIMVNDGSPDNSWQVIQEISREDGHVKGMNLSRNFGQHNAITAGLDHAKGCWIVIMDCDLQDRPEEIINFYHKALEGFDIVVGRRMSRKDKILNIITSRLFYQLYNYLTDQNVDSTISSFGIYSNKVIQNIQSMRERTRSFGRFAYWVGFKRAEIDITHAERSAGQSGYNLRKRISLAVDSILAYSNKPLKLTIKFGFFMSFICVIYIIYLMFRYYFFSISVTGWTSLIVSLYFLAGLIISLLGMVGLYIGKIFDEVKQRPLYIIESATFKDDRMN